MPGSKVVRGTGVKNPDNSRVAIVDYACLAFGSATFTSDASRERR
jgi:hypothetical protein